MVKGVNFVNIRDAGDPVECCRAYCAAGADEIAMLDITATVESRATMLEVVRKVAAVIQGERYSSTYGYADGISQWDITTRHTITLKHFTLEPGLGIENIFNQRDTSPWEWCTRTAHRQCLRDRRGCRSPGP